MAKKITLDVNGFRDTEGIEQEWMRLPSEHHRCSSDYIDALAKQEEAKEALDKVTSDLDQDIRSELMQTVKTPTEKSIKAKMLQEDDYLEAISNYNEARTEVERCSYALRTLDIKREALKNLTQLNINHWHSESSLPREFKDRADKQTQDEHKDDLDRTMNPRRKRGPQPIS